MVCRDKSLVVKKNSFKERLLRIKEIIAPPVKIIKVSSNMEIIRDVRVTMKDGVTLSINIYKPKGKDSLPALLNLHPYNKDNLPQNGHIPLQYRVIRQSSPITFSEETSWEAPDPEFWVNHNYAVVNIDKRGFGKSNGVQKVLVDEEAQDYYEVIEWIAAQAWSNGKVGLFGVSYLAISQYKVASLAPPHLKAICPWEGFSDAYKDAVYPGGINENGFMEMWSRGVKPRSGLTFKQELSRHKLRDEFFQALVPDLSQITIPALICASFSDHQLHSRGSFRAFEQISSNYKWLYTHRGGKWATFYSDEAKAIQLKFFDFFLKDINNGMLNLPQVRVEVRKSRETISKIRQETKWPLKSTQWTELFLDNSNYQLTQTPDLRNLSDSFLTNKQSLKFNYRFTDGCEVIGPMKLTLYLALENCDDINLFVGVQKFHQGKEVSFEGSYGFANDIVTKGFMKASLSKINQSKSLFYQPEHDFSEVLELSQGQIFKLEISLLPSATVFDRNDEMRLVIQGRPLIKCGKLDQIGQYEPSLAGVCHIWSGKNYPSSLLIPIIK